MGEPDADWLVDIEPMMQRSSSEPWVATIMEFSAHILATLFHEFGLRLTLWLLLLIRHGPFSWKRPIMLELPGYEAKRQWL